MEWANESGKALIVVAVGLLGDFFSVFGWMAEFLGIAEPDGGSQFNSAGRWFALVVASFMAYHHLAKRKDASDDAIEGRDTLIGTIGHTAEGRVATFRARCEVMSDEGQRISRNWAVAHTLGKEPTVSPSYWLVGLDFFLDEYLAPTAYRRFTDLLYAAQAVDSTKSGEALALDKLLVTLPVVEQIRLEISDVDLSMRVRPPPDLPTPDSKVPPT